MSRRRATHRGGNRTARVLALCAVLLLGQAAGAAAGDCTAPRKAADLGFTLDDVRGEAVRLDRFRGAVIVMNFWATWCAPCRREIPWLNALVDAYRDRGLTVLGISVDEDVARIAPFVAEMRMGYPVLRGARQEAFQEAFGPLLGFPTTVLITRDGIICARYSGITSREVLEHDVRALLGVEPGS